jgi:hypothetical protein
VPNLAVAAAQIAVTKPPWGAYTPPVVKWALPEKNKLDKSWFINGRGKTSHFWWLTSHDDEITRTPPHPTILPATSLPRFKQSQFSTTRSFFLMMTLQWKYFRGTISSWVWLNSGFGWFTVVAIDLVQINKFKSVDVDRYVDMPEYPLIRPDESEVAVGNWFRCTCRCRADVRGSKFIKHLMLLIMYMKKQKFILLPYNKLSLFL